jgi:AcrR family transcriptional regulator
MTNNSETSSSPTEPVVSRARSEAREALLDAALRLLREVGFSKITTRRLAAAAGVNQGLVHYYFGSVEEVLFQAFERFSDALLSRQRVVYSTSGPFLERWREAMRHLEEDLAAGYPKIGFELAALSWNHPRFQVRAAAVMEGWRVVLTEAFEGALAEYGLDRERFPLEGIVSLVMTFNLGYMFESLAGVEQGHQELIAMIDRWLVGLEHATNGAHDE